MKYMANKKTPKTTVETIAQTPTFLYDEVLKKCLEYFGGDELAATTWMNKYAMTDAEGKYVEASPDDMHRRMAKQFARIETKHGSATNLGAKTALLSEYGQQRHPMSEDDIYNLFRDFKYVIPQGSVMAALGNPYMLASLSNCVVIPEVHDSYGGIMYTDQQLVQLFKRRCGVGLDMSTIRPSGLRVNNAAGSTSGAVSFMERFSNTTREVSQNGRRGALMITMDIAHPNVEDFVTIKQELTKVTGANVSVRISDEFMKAVRDNKDYTHRWPIDAKKPKITKKVNARELWNTIIECAHNTAEPGLIFWDRQHYYSTSSVYPEFKNTSTNPCSEIAMQGGDSCRLIAINLYSFVEDPFTENAAFNHKKFWKTTYEAQRLMDDLVDLELEAIERILDKVKSDPEPDHIKQVEIDTWQLLYDAGKKGRRTGLGFTALADACAALGLKFDTDEAMAEMEQMMRTKCDAEFQCSIDMAIERGKFEAFDTKIENTSEFVQMLKKEFPNIYERMMQHEGAVIVLYQIPADDETPFVNCFLPKAHAWCEQAGWILADLGGFCVGIRPIGAYEWEKIHEPGKDGNWIDGWLLRIDDRHAGLMLEAVEMAEAGSFESYRRVRADAHFDLDEWPSKSRVAIDTFAGVRLEMTYDGPHHIDGEAIDYSAYPLLGAPGVDAPLGSGRATFRHGEDTLGLDFGIDADAAPLPMRVIG